MYKNIILLISIGIIFGLDKDWTTYEGHEISLNTIIIKIDNELAPKLGAEAPLTMDQVFPEQFWDLSSFPQNQFHLHQ